MSVQILHGDCLTLLADFPADSIEACVTDPPYHLQSIVKRFGRPNAVPARVGKTGAYARASAGFMGKQWDGGDISFRPETWAAIGRVLRPGAHLVAFGGTRTFHRIAVAIEDAGFELRDTLMWVYGTGFPKSHNQHGEWEGWGTALKPAWEPIILARKPLVGTVAENLRVQRTGAINVDGCRIEGEKDTPVSTRRTSQNAGRWPANLAHDGSDDVVGCFPIAPGQQGRAKQDDTAKTNVVYGKFARNETRVPEPRGDAGSAARFFYCAKATRADREDGLSAFAEKPLHWSSGSKNPGSFQSEGTKKAAKNNHPTVKPTDLMRWLCRMVVPPGGTVLDPFMGSGSTGRGAVAEGFGFIGIEQDAGYAEIARARIGALTVSTTEDLLA